MPVVGDNNSNKQTPHNTNNKVHNYSYGQPFQLSAAPSDYTLYSIGDTGTGTLYSLDRSKLSMSSGRGRSTQPRLWPCASAWEGLKGLGAVDPMGLDTFDDDERAPPSFVASEPTRYSDDPPKPGDLPEPQGAATALRPGSSSAPDSARPSVRTGSG